MLIRPRIYLDTSVISYLDQQDAPEKMLETQEVWKILETGKYEVIISDIAMTEINECNEEKKQKLIQYINSVEYKEYETNNDTKELANLIIEEGILRPKSLDDALHIAAAILSEADIILSWNFKHLVNIETINGVRKICFSKRFNKLIDIYSPNVLLKKGEDEDENN